MKDRRTIGRYDIERVLGKGGMGIVWLAQDPSLSRQVALKHLREDLVLTPEQRDDLFARMRIEARAAAHLTHPNVVTLHDVGEDEALGPWLVFEYVEGPSLRDELKHGPFQRSTRAGCTRCCGCACVRARSKRPSSRREAGERARITNRHETR